MENSGQNKIKSIIKAVVILAVVIGAGYFAMNNASVKSLFNKNSNPSQEEINKLVAKAGKLIILPSGENPVVATINDAETLKKEQPFYNDAINGDIILVYATSTRAIIYSPSRDIIVNSGPIFLENTKTPATATSTSTKKK